MEITGRITSDASVQKVKSEKQVVDFSTAFLQINSIRKKNSLILSTKVNGHSVETIEVPLKTMEIMQCREIKNRNSPYHKRIIDLMNRNLYQIKERLKKATSPKLA